MDRTALVVIDAQQEYFAPLGRIVLPDGPPAVERIAELLAWARERGMPIVHVVHESRRPNPTTFVPGSKNFSTSCTFIFRQSLPCPASLPFTYNSYWLSHATWT